MSLMFRRVLCLCTFILASLPLFAQVAPAPKTPMSFPQLIATRYPNGTPLPADVTPPPPTTFSSIDRSLLPTGATILSAASLSNGIEWVLTDKGNFRREGTKYVPFDLPTTLKPFQPQVNADTRLVAVAADGKGHLWAATTLGLLATDGKQWWHVIDHNDGMPYVHMTCLLLAPNGDVWGGTTEGAWRLRDGTFRYFYGKRWLPGNRVDRLWSGTDGRIYLQTDGGVACIIERAMTLREKAEHMESITARHNRRGYVTNSALKTSGTPENGVILSSDDNDGLWTSLYIGAESLRFAATTAPQAKTLAKRSMDALLELERLTGVPGYPARSVVTDEELASGVTGVDLQETVRIDGENEKIWFRSPVEKNVWCKGDTSSDELVGHYLAYYLYSEYVADATEKQRVAATVRRITDNILQHDLTLVGHTGRKTRWGVWSPKYLNDDPRWREERNLNSFQILCFLKVASYLCGDKRFADAYEDLITNHHYLLNALLYRRHVPWWAINHSDDELAYLSYYPLLRLEKDPARRRLLVQSIALTWEDSDTEQTIRQEKSPFYNFLYGGATGLPCASDDAITSLQEWPWELINWTVTNSHRHDVTVRFTPASRNQSGLTRVLPFSERRVMRWNGDPFQGDYGDDGASEEDGTAFLFPYWLGVHHGYIARTQ